MNFQNLPENLLLFAAVIFLTVAMVKCVNYGDCIKKHTPADCGPRP